MENTGNIENMGNIENIENMEKMQNMQKMNNISHTTRKLPEDFRGRKANLLLLVFK